MPVRGANALIANEYGHDKTEVKQELATCMTDIPFLIFYLLFVYFYLYPTFPAALPRSTETPFHAMPSQARYLL